MSAPAVQQADPSAIRTAGRRIRRTWWLIALAAILTLAAVFTTTTARSTAESHPDNANSDGSRALAEILRQQGVEVRVVITVADAVALATSGTGATVLVTNLNVLGEEVADLASLEADVVIEGSPYLDHLPSLTDAIIISPAGSTVNLYPQCDDADAVAAGRITSSRGSVMAAQDDVEVCFPVGGTGTGGAYAVWEQNGHTWRYLSDMSIFHNDLLAEDGNAALGLRALGHNRLLVWLVPERPAPDTLTGEQTPFFPPWFEPALLVGLGVVLILIVAGGGRMGRVVTEPLPVVVRPGETVIGRGTLYRRAGSVAHSAQGLRAGTARRLAAATGTPRSAGPEEIVAAAAASSGRHPDQVGALLYGPPPTRTKQLTELAAALKALESEVRHS